MVFKMEAVKIIREEFGANFGVQLAHNKKFCHS